MTDVTTSDGERLAVFDEGGGRAVLLCHSLASSSADLAPLANELLGRGWRVIRFDQRGHGRSSGPGEVSVRRLAQDVQEVVIALELQDVVTVGHSSGGYALLALDPAFVRDRVRGIVCVGTTPKLTSMTERSMMRYAGSATAARLQTTRLVGKRLVRLGAFGRPADAALVEATWRTAASCRPETRRAFAGAMLREPDLSRSLATLGAPVVAMRGSRDRVVSEQRTRELAALAPDGVHIEVAGAGHLLVVERPAAVADAVAAATPRSSR